MKPTRAGIGLAVVCVACFVLGRLFGTTEMFYLSAICLAALVFAVIYTATAQLDLTVARTANPSRLRAGTPARIDLSLLNLARRRTPVLRVQDHVQNSSGASLLLAPIKGRDRSEIAYRLPTRRRGRLDVGPLDLTLGDPLGLTSSTVRASDQVTLMVHAKLIDLGVLHARAGHDPTADQQPIRALASGGDEFFALRPYVVGDELRRVHWRASARTGELVVKQEERPRTGRVTVVLDRRRSVYDEEGFERAVSAALSALHAGWRGDDALRFLTSASPGFTDIRSRAELDAVDEQLAMVTSTEGASLVRTIDEITRVGRGGTLILVTGIPTEELNAAIEGARRSFGLIHTVLCQPVASTSIPGAIMHTPESDFQAEWNEAQHRSTTIRTTTGGATTS